MKIIHYTLTALSCLSLLHCTEPGDPYQLEPIDQKLLMTQDSIVPMPMNVNHYYIPEGWVGDVYSVNVSIDSLRTLEESDLHSASLLKGECVSDSHYTESEQSKSCYTIEYNQAIEEEEDRYFGMHWLDRFNWGENSTRFYVSKRAQKVTAWIRAYEPDETDSIKVIIGSANSDIWSHNAKKTVVQMTDTWEKYEFKLSGFSQCDFLSTQEIKPPIYTAKDCDDAMQARPLINAFAWYTRAGIPVGDYHLKVSIDSISWSAEPMIGEDPEFNIITGMEE
ncbi:MAG: hypothetical protein OCC49_12815 [Fibrobacterales bacterium]